MEVETLATNLPFFVHHSVQIENVFRILQGVVSQDCKFFLFGSFARGEDRHSSDIDVALDAGEPLPLSVIGEMRAQIEDSNIPFSVDLIDLNRTSALLREQIQKEGIEWIE